MEKYYALHVVDKKGRVHTTIAISPDAIENRIRSEFSYPSPRPAQIALQ